MLEKILPQTVLAVLREKLNLEKLYEIRLRSQKPVMLNYCGRYLYLTPDGASEDGDKAYVLDRKAVENIVFRASEHSLYVFNEQIKQSFITIAGGIRLGICGELVIENGAVKTVKNFTSVNVRIPHEVKNCSLNCFKYIADKQIYNTLIVSPPGAGKTTWLRDVACQLARLSPPPNILILDERGEIAAVSAGVAQLDTGPTGDVMTNCGKGYGFEQGIRSMRPDVIITDELANPADVEAAAGAIAAGVKIIASTHAFDHLDLNLKPAFESVLKKRLFSRFVVLSNRRGPGTCEGVYDEQFGRVY
ncbi:MAG: stage III sporulation protein AA [Clostridiales bacterium]|jgi:stage III sporulation protein AA|nr:stage III sporulation protein AA [Clostridiales bacterium]